MSDESEKKSTGKRIYTIERTVAVSGWVTEQIEVEASTRKEALRIAKNSDDFEEVSVDYEYEDDDEDSYAVIAGDEGEAEDEEDEEDEEEDEDEDDEDEGDEDDEDE